MPNMISLSSGVKEICDALGGRDGTDGMDRTGQLSPNNMISLATSWRRHNHTLEMLPKVTDKLAVHES